MVALGAACQPDPAPDPQPSTTAGSVTPSPSATATGPVSPDRPTPRVPTVMPSGATGAPGRGLDDYRNQQLTWTACGAALCATALAPLNYSAPGEAAITLSLRKIPATAPRIGTLFVNPGGPGFPGTDLASRFDRTGLEGYDIIGWDPRGVGASSAVECFQGDDMDAWLALDSSPDDSAERQALIVANRSFGQSCLERTGELLGNISSIDTARDLDLLRELVGESKVNYFGYSYGTYLGALYAHLYPQHTGRLVLDGAVAINESDREQQVLQAEGFDRALGHFADWCVQQRCALGEDREAVLAAVVRIFDATDVHPMRTADPDRPLTQSLAVTGVLGQLYSEQFWPALAGSLQQAAGGDRKSPDGSALLSAADSYNQRDSDGRYGQSAFAFPAIYCLDHADQGLDQALADWKQAQQKAPIFGRYLGPSLTCPVWPVAPRYPRQDLTAKGAAPFVVIGTTGDPATPYEDVERMARELEPAVLLTLEGEGHGAYGRGNACIDTAVRRYLVDGVLPTDGTRCTS